MALGGLGSGLVGGGLLAGTAHVDVRPDLSTFGPRLRTELTGIIRSVGAFKFDAFDKSLAGIGASTAKLGGLLTKGLTVPIVGAGAVAFKFGADFDAVLQRMIGLAGVSAGEIDGIRQSLLGLASETGRAPTELANALYLVRSAGLVGQQALDAVEVSAKASAAGMGDTSAVASALTSVLNAYAKTGLTAAQAGDILTAAVRDGAAEADQFAAVIGDVVPLASQLSVGFDQVAASIASLTQVGIDPQTAATNIRQIFASLLSAGKEGTQSAKALESVGLTAEKLRADLAKPQGILIVLREIEEAFRGNDEALQQVFPNIRALTGVLGLLGQKQDAVNKTFNDAANATGSLDHAFTEAQKSAKFKLQRALADAQVALVSFGEAVAPAGEKLAGFASSTFQAFSKLPDGVKTSTVAIGGLLAAVGPVSFVGGKVVSSLGKIAGAVKGSATAFSSFRLGLRGIETGLGGATSNKLGSFVRGLGPAGVAGGLGLVTGALIVGGIALDNWQQKKEEARKRVVAFTDALRADSGAVGENTRAFIVNELQQRNQLDDLGRITPALKSHRSAIDVLTDAIGGNVAAQREFRQGLIDSGEIKLVGPQSAVDEFIRSGKEFSNSGRVIIVGNKELVHEFNNLVGANKDAATALTGTAGATRKAADVDRDLAAAKQHLADLVAAHSTDEKALGDAHRRVADLTAERKRIDDALAGSETKLDQTEKSHVTTLESMLDKELALVKARADAADAVTAFKDAEKTLDEARADAAGTGENAVAAAKAEQDALRGLQQASERVTDGQDKLADATQGVVDAQLKLAEARQDLADLDSGPNKRISTLEREQIVRRVVETPEEARQKEIDLLKFDEDAADKRKSAQEQVADAQRGVQDAVERVGDAERSLRDDVRAVAEAQGKVAEAAQARKQVQSDALLAVEGLERKVELAMFAAIEAFNQAKEDKTPLGPWLDALREIDALVDPKSPMRKNLDDLLALSAPQPSSWFASNGQELTGRGSFAPAPASQASEADALRIYSRLNPELRTQVETTALPLSQADIIEIIKQHIGPGDSRLTAEQVEFLRKLGVPMFGTGGIADWPMGQPRLSVLHGQEQVTRPGQVIGADRPHVTVNAPITVSDRNVAGQVQVELRKQAIRLANTGVRG